MGYTLSDYSALVDTNPEENELFMACAQAFYGKGNDNRRRVCQKISPCYLVNETTDVLVDDGKGWTCGSEHTFANGICIKSEKISYELHVFEEGSHGMALGTYATAGSRCHLDTNVENWVPMADKWLQKRLAPEIPEVYQGF